MICISTETETEARTEQEASEMGKRSRGRPAGPVQGITPEDLDFLVDEDEDGEGGSGGGGGSSDLPAGGSLGYTPLADLAAPRRTKSGSTGRQQGQKQPRLVAGHQRADGKPRTHYRDLVEGTQSEVPRGGPFNVERFEVLSRRVLIQLTRCPVPNWEAAHEAIAAAEAEWAEEMGDGGELPEELS